MAFHRWHDSQAAVRRRLRRRAWLVAGLAILMGVVLRPSAARAEHASIELDVIGPDGQAEAHADQEPPEGGSSKRPTLAVKAGDPLVLQFVFTNTYPHGVVKGVTVRYFVVRIDKIGQKKLPNLKTSEGVVTQGEITMDFKPKCRVGTRLKFRVDQPGIYLVRVDTVDTQSDHEHFSAIDLEVK